MASKIKVDQIEGSTASTVTLPSGQTLDLSSGSVTLPDNAVDLSSAKVTSALPLSKGGTGLTSLGTAGQIIQVNSGASALEFADASSGKIGAVAFGKLTTATTLSSGASYVDTGLSATITPTAAGSSIMAIISISSGANNGTVAGHHYALYRNVNSAGDTKIDAFTGDASGSRNRGIFAGASESGSDWTQESSASSVLDSSSTGLSYSLGNAIEYSVYWYAPNTQASINRSYRDSDGNDDTRTISTIMLLEILA